MQEHADMNRVQCVIRIKYPMKAEGKCMFDTTQKVLGKGKQGTVYYQDGFAYKAFGEGYQLEWIEYERSIMRAVAKTGIPMPHCYEYEDPSVIKMDYIEGITLADRMLKLNYETSVEDLINLQKSIHQCECSEISRFKNCSKVDLQAIEGFEQEKKAASEYLDEIEDRKSLLHLDFHFLNVIYTNGNYTILDWNSARQEIQFLILHEPMSFSMNMTTA